MKNNQKLLFEIEKEAADAPETVEVTAINYQGSVQLVKTDEVGKALKEAVFNLVDKEGKVIREELVSNAEGKIKADKLEPGTYYFVETKAPAGYILNTDKVKVEIVAESQDGHADINNLKLINYQGSAVLTKVNPLGQTLMGAEFSLFIKEAGSDHLISKGLVSDENGLVNVTNLAPGHYYFKETKAPTGYLLSTEEKAFEIAREAAGKPELSKVSLTNRPVKPAPLYSKGKTSSGSSKGHSDLPQAGTKDSTLVTLLGASLLVGTVIVKRKRKAA